MSTKIAKKIVGDDFVKFEFANGEILVCSLDDLSEETVRKLAVHGLSQKEGDSYAGAESIAEAVSSAKTVWNNLVNDLWTVKVSRGGRMVEALVRATGKTFEECLEKYTDMDEAAQKDLKKHPAIVQALADIEVERAAVLVKAAEGTDVKSLDDIFDMETEAETETA